MSEQPLVRELPRGGVVVQTSAGPVQLGIPPETIKDAMSLGLSVPTHYVIPEERFDRQRGINVSEVEFPAYFNFFVLKKRVNLICDADAEARVRAIVTETLFGPQSYPASDVEYDPSVPLAARPHHPTECGQFRKNPFQGGQRLEVDSLIEFTRFDPAGVARVGEVAIRRLPDQGGYVIEDGGRELTRLPAKVRLPDREPAPAELPAPFDPPAFGVTVLGSSHGFDPAGKTTGFIVWINHRGLMVDPPMGSTELLAANGIAPKLIDGIILSHCHADHDSGTFQKILEEGRVALYTSPVILGSFLRKYSALSGLDEEFLRRTFVFRPVRIGSSLRVHGGELRFFYSLHSIPALGFEAYYGGKSLVFSGDTLYDPERIQAMVDAGTITRERGEALINFPWHHSLVLHEAGVPPLHTPVSALAKLPAEARERLRLIHIAAKDLPADCGLQVAPVGVEHTLRLDAEPPRHAEAIELLDLFTGIDLFRNFPLGRARELLQVAERVRFAKGERIIAQGTPGDAFYVILKGQAGVVQDGKELKRYMAGDFFGETALLLRQPRNADVVATTEVEVYQIERYDFLYLLRGTDIPRRLARLAQMREERSWELFERNSALQPLTSAQKTQLQSLLELRDTRPGQYLWSAGEVADAVYLVDEGRVALEGYARALAPYGPGAWLGEVDAVLAGTGCSGSARVVEGGRVFRVGKAELAAWFQEYPGLHLAFLGTRAVE